MENFCRNGLEFCGIGSFPQPLPELFAAFKKHDHAVPVFLHAKNGVSCAAEGLNISFQQFIMEGADFAYCPADGVIADRFETVCECGEGAVADVIYEKIPKILGLQP